MGSTSEEEHCSLCHCQRAQEGATNLWSSDFLMLFSFLLASCKLNDEMTEKNFVHIIEYVNLYVCARVCISYMCMYDILYIYIQCIPYDIIYKLYKRLTHAYIQTPISKWNYWYYIYAVGLFSFYADSVYCFLIWISWVFTAKAISKAKGRTET